jgi:hypothetical protein
MSFAAISSCYGYCLLETQDLAFSADIYLRQDIVTFKNVVDLDNKNSDDTTTYLGIDYSLGLDLKYKNGGPEFYLKLERNGPYDYDAPLFIHNTLVNSCGRIEKYRNEQLLPQLEEFWLDAPLANALRVKLGLYAYSVGNGFSLNGGYENYGFTIFKEAPDFSWRFYYCRPDIVYKNHLGPSITLEKEHGISHDHSVANFFAADIKLKQGNTSWQPYLGILADYTGREKRNNSFSSPTEKDILGTFGLAWEYQFKGLSLALEAAHNFGKAESTDSSYEDVYHSGYLVYTGIGYELKKVSPSFKFLLCSGNEVSDEAALNQDTTLTSGRNRAFSYYSPLNHNLGDSVSSSNFDMLPIVAMGGGYGLNYGVPRPGTFSPADFDNLIMPSLGLDFNATDKLCIGFYWYYLNSFARGVGILNAEPKHLSRELGNELDLFIDYQLNEHTLFSILGGYFIPGKYYREVRDSGDETLFNPLVRADGEVDNAYQIELALEFKI